MNYTEERALALLGSNISPAQVAAALGVSESYISQLLSRPDFSGQVASLRFENLQAHNARDQKADSLEDKILSKLEETLPLVCRPMELARLYQVVNSAKRRGSTAPESTLQHQRIVNITIPVQIAAKFSATPDNYVHTAGEQSLLTMQSSQLLSLHQNKIKLEKPHAHESAAGVAETHARTGT